jgi:hypothetical protein
VSGSSALAFFALRWFERSRISGRFGSARLPEVPQRPAQKFALPSVKFLLRQQAVMAPQFQGLDFDPDFVRTLDEDDQRCEGNEAQDDCEK